MGGRDWRGPTVFLLAVGVVSVLLIAAVGAALNHNVTVSTEEVALIAGILGAAIGCIATYLGQKMGDRPIELPRLTTPSELYDQDAPPRLVSRHPKAPPPEEPTPGPEGQLGEDDPDRTMPYPAAPGPT